MRMPFIIAEAGSCHEGQFDRAVKLLEVAKAADADAIKFQYWSSPARMRERRHVDTPDAYERGSVFEHWLPELSAMAHAQGLEFMCTAYLPEDIAKVAPFVDRFKVSSFEATPEFISRHSMYEKDIVVSDGMKGGTEGGEPDLPWYKEYPWRLHCVSAYPTPLSQANLSVLASKHYGGVEYDGYSDHTRCIYTGGFAVSAGADMLEVHYRLADTSEKCPDYPVALSPDGLAQYIMLARMAYVMRGDGVKRVQPSEQGNLKHRVTG